MRSNAFVQRFSGLRPFSLPVLTVFLGSSLSTVLAAVPQYHLTALVIPGMQGIYVNDINDAGEMVGYYVDADFNDRAFLWDANGPHDLAVPAASGGGDMSSAAVAINNAGQIVGYAQDIGVSAPGMLWSSADPTQYTLLDDDPAVGLSPNDISDNGTVVGLKANLQTGEALHGFVWTAQTGDVDYGTTDPSDDSINASWTAVNDAGQLAGVWNFQFAPSHVSVGTVGTPSMQPLGAASDAVESGVLAINAMASASATWMWTAAAIRCRWCMAPTAAPARSPAQRSTFLPVKRSASTTPASSSAARMISPRSVQSLRRHRRRQLRPLRPCRRHRRLRLFPHRRSGQCLRHDRRPRALRRPAGRQLRADPDRRRWHLQRRLRSLRLCAFAALRRRSAALYEVLSSSQRFRRLHNAAANRSAALRSVAPIQRDDAGTAEAEIVLQGDARALDLAHAGAAAQLRNELGALARPVAPSG